MGLSPAVFDQLPVYGDGPAFRADTRVVRIRYSFYCCMKCRQDIGGYDAVAERQYPTMFQSEVYHAECAPSALCGAVKVRPIA